MTAVSLCNAEKIAAKNRLCAAAYRPGGCICEDFFGGRLEVEANISGF